MKQFRGLHTAVVTPFTREGLVDYEAFRAIIEMQIRGGVDGVVPSGTTGESPTLSLKEMGRLVATAVEVANGRVAVIAGTGSNSTEEAVRLSKIGAANGADALLLVNPYYNRPTQKGLYLHFRKIADSVDIPCILYNIKGRTGVNLETSTLVKLATECDNIVAVKEASGDLEQMKAVIAQAPANFTVLSGDDNISLDLIEAGGDGVVSVASNIIPNYMSRMIGSALEGDLKEARQIEGQLAPFFGACFVETNPIPIKTVMAHYGWCEEVFRLPMCSLEQEEHRTLILKSLENLEIENN
jgi:4-hydroxy-tetrahydrodipicolinate synthase